MSWFDHATPDHVRARLSHPVIDADGHWLHYGPVFREEIRKVGGDVALEGVLSVSRGNRAALSMSVAERRRRGIAQEAFWSLPERNTRDRATAMLPRLLHERLGEIGLDYAVVYPTAGGIPRIADDVRRRAACRAWNVVTMDYFYKLLVGLTGGLADLDDYAACAIERDQDWRDLFVRPFFFGCEADDPINAWAFDRRVNPFGARLRAVFGSDIGHFDVPDMRGVLPEAFELVERGLLTADDFRDFTFANAVRLWGGVNPRFFEGTAVEREAAAVLAGAESGAP